MKCVSTSAAVCLMMATAAAQSASLSCQVSPNPVTPGGAMTFAVQATVPGYLASGCGINEIRQGTPTGPIVWQPFLCPLILIPVGPGGFYGVNFQASGMAGPLAPGTYYAIINWSGGGVSQPSGVFPFRVDSPNTPPDPVLSASGNLVGGQTTNLTITSLTDPGAFYICAASRTTNIGWSLPGGQHVSLDMNDPIFALSYPAAVPGVFNGFSGALNGSGVSSGISITIPAGVIATGSPGAVQGAVIDTAGNIKLTNALTFSVQ